MTMRFLMDQRLFNKCSDAMYASTCARAPGRDMVRLRCALGRCRDCPRLEPVRAEQEYSTSESGMFISWQEFENTYEVQATWLY